MTAPVTTTTAAQKRRRRRSLELSRRDKTVLGLMAGIPALIHIVFVWVPTFATIFLSFTKWDGIKPIGQAKAVGFKNFWEIFHVFNQDFFQALINNGVLLVFLFIGPTLLGMLLAYQLDKGLRGTRVYQSIFYFPVVLSLAVVGFIWKSVMYSSSQGLLNNVLGRTAEGNQIDWIGDQRFLIHFGSTWGISRNYLAILVAMAWRHAGYIMVLYLAGLKSVDPSLREAAAIDGCSEWQSFRRIVFPTMKPINIVVLVITVIEALRAFDIVFALKKPRHTEQLSVLVTNNLLGEGGGNVGRGSAYGVILLVLCLGFIVWYVVTRFREDL
jgi:ABC-type sugar transport system permease subunit